MSVLGQLCVIFGVYLAAEGISAVLPFPFPESVAGMVVFLALLFSRLLKPHHLQESSDFLLKNMGLFYVPVTVSVVKYVPVLLENIWAIVLICILTTPLVFLVTGHVAQLTVKLLAKGGKVRG